MTTDPSRPLMGMRIAITRPSEQTVEISKKVVALGGVPVEFPTIRIAPPADYSMLDNALSSLERYDWLVFTSANGVKHFFERVAEKGTAIKNPRCGIATVGPSTAAAVDSQGLVVSFLPSTYLTEKLASDLPQVDGRRILLVRAEGVDANMKSILTQRGATVDEAYAYRVLPNESGEIDVDFDAILFTSPSTVSSFRTMFHKESMRVSRNAIVCCIGPVTAKAAQDLGFRVDVVSAVHTAEGLLNALVERVRQG